MNSLNMFLIGFFVGAVVVSIYYLPKTKHAIEKSPPRVEAFVTFRDEWSSLVDFRITQAFVNNTQAKTPEELRIKLNEWAKLPDEKRRLIFGSPDNFWEDNK